MDKNKARITAVAITIAVIVGILAAITLGLYAIRPLGVLHGTVMFFYLHPVLTIGLGMVGVAFLAALFNIAENFAVTVSAWLFGIIGVLVALTGMVFQHAWNAEALYATSDYKAVTTLPEGGVVRVMPKEVADQIVNNNFSSSTETLRNSHIVRERDGQLHWTYEQAPNGMWRSITQNTAGAVSITASEVNGDTVNYEQKFDVGPSMRYSDGIRWRVYKKHYLANVTEIFAIPVGENEVLFAAPYVKYKGFLKKSPYFAGVVLVHHDGRIEDLTPEQAAKNSILAESGRLFPEKLARQIHDAYAYNGGILNKWFAKQDVTQIPDPDENNSQPYLLSFGDSLKWVSVAEPASKEGAVKAVFLTDAVDGKTEIWRVNKSQSFAGPRRALDAAAGRNYEGIVFGSGRGKFKAAEPRPVFYDNRLHYLISIIPSTRTEVTKSVIVDADKNRVVAVFNHDTDPEATDKLLESLESGKLPEKSVPDSVEDLGENATIAEQLEALLAEERADAAEDQKRLQRLEALTKQLREQEAGVSGQ
jgi:hypothetical protein